MCKYILPLLHNFYVNVNIEFYVHASVQLYDGEKTDMLKCFCNSSTTDIGANNSSQIIPVKNHGSQSRYRVWLP